MSRKLRSALARLAKQVSPGPMEARLEAAIDRETNLVLLALAEDMAGKEGNPRMQRSAAARHLMKCGAMWKLAQEAGEA